MNKWGWMEEELGMLQEQHLYRQVKVIESAQSSHVQYRGRDMLMLASNSYLDLCAQDCIKEYAAQVLREYGTGSGGSRLTTGTTKIHMELEESLARFKGREGAVVFNTGFAANSGILPVLCRKGDVIYSDALNHASIIDGCRQSGAETVIYAHNDMADLEKKILAHPGRRGLIVSDGVFSMDGDIVDLPGLVELADTYGLLSMIDEAHATGVVGASGRGCEEYFHMEGRTDILMGTLSKALGAEGGYVCGPRICRIRPGATFFPLLFPLCPWERQSGLWSCWKRSPGEFAGFRIMSNGSADSFRKRVSLPDQRQPLCLFWWETRRRPWRYPGSFRRKDILSRPFDIPRSGREKQFFGWL